MDADTSGAIAARTLSFADADKLLLEFGVSREADPGFRPLQRVKCEETQEVTQRENSRPH